MKEIIIILSLILLSGCSVTKLINAKKDEVVNAENRFVKIEFNNQPILEVNFPSGEIKKMALDLGAGTSILLKNTGLSYIDTLKPELLFGKSISVNNKKEKNTYYRVGLLKTNGFSISNAFFPAVSGFQANPCKDISGVWGADVFEGKILVLKPEDSTLAVFDTLPNLNGWSLIESEYKYPYFYTYVKIGNKKVRLLLDTGSSSSIAISNSYFEKVFQVNSSIFTQVDKIYGSAFVSSIGAISDTTLIYHYNQATIGDLSIPKLKILTNDNLKRNTIGMQVLKRFNIMLDYKSYKLYLQLIPGLNEMDKGRNLSEKGLFLKLSKDNRVVVSAIQVNSDAEKAGLKVDDFVLSINKVQVDDLNICDAITRFTEITTHNKDNEIVVWRENKTIVFYF